MFEAGERLSRAAFAEVSARAIGEAFKWNITGEGQTRLCDFPLIVDQHAWRHLARAAEELDREARAAEEEILARPGLAARVLGVPPLLADALRLQPSLRYARYDFHPTILGDLAITEGNLDVAGGWSESGLVTEIFAEHVAGARPAGNPARALIASIAPDATFGVMHLTRYTDDHQVARYLGSVAREHHPVLFDPTQLRRSGSRAAARVGERTIPLDVVFRFFPAEWSCRLPDARAWLALAHLGGTIWSNPLSAVLAQSKRFPLAWPQLTTKLPAWSRHLPQTRGPTLRKQWVHKPALGHEGDRVVMGPAPLAALISPGKWAAQRRFVSRPIDTPDGALHLALGVFVVAGKAAGLFARVAERPLIDDRSREVVVLVRA